MQDARTIPEAAIRDPNSVEMLRVWIAEQQLHCSLKIGMYEEQGIDEARAWGIMLSDVIRHVSHALHLKHDHDEEKIATDIRRHLLSEFGSPTSDTTGDFL
jgi:hypothetical protein